MSCKVKACAFPEERDNLCVYHLRDVAAGSKYDGILDEIPSPQPTRRIMANKCAVASCNYLAVSGELNCTMHRTARVPRDGKIDVDGFEFVPMTDVPSTGRYNESAGKLFATVKTCPEGQALKVSLSKFKKVTLVTAQRYALAGGVRLGVRFVGQTGFIWKMNPAEIEKMKAKGERLSAARGKRKRAA